MLHTLKIWPEYFASVSSGDKSFEVRRNDRNFTKGDMLLMKEYDPESRGYTGNNLACEVTYILTDRQSDALQKGYVVMGIKVMTDSARSHF